MDYLYFACNQIIERDNIGYLPKPNEIADNLGCASWGMQDRSPEGYQIIKYMIRVPSQEVFNTFVKQVHPFGFKDWFSISEVNLPVPSNHSSSVADHNIQSVWLDGMRAIAYDNNKLGEKLNSEIALHFACDWTALTSLTDDWLRKLMRSVANLTLGCEIRLKGTKQTENGLTALIFTLRVFSESELDRFIKHAGEGFDKWYQISKDEFINSLPFSENTTIGQDKRNSLINQAEKIQKDNFSLLNGS